MFYSLILILSYINFCQGQIEVLSTQPLIFEYQGQQRQLCVDEQTMDFINNQDPNNPNQRTYLDESRVLASYCREQGYLRSFEIGGIIQESALTCDPLEGQGLKLDCLYEGGESLEDCQSITLMQQCQLYCANFFCQNYRCDQQEVGSHNCVSCIGTGTGLYERAAVTCECQNGKIDIYPLDDNCQDPPQSSDGDISQTQFQADLIAIQKYGQYRAICLGMLIIIKFIEEATLNIAKVACRQLGFNYAVQIENIVCPGETYSDQIPDTVEFWFVVESCSGTEDTLEECNRSTYSRSNSCSYDSCFNVQCFQLPDDDGLIKIENINSPTNLQSIVEIQHYNFDQSQLEWRPICDYSINDNIAHVMCFELGFQTFKNYFKQQECPTVSGEQQFWLGRISCQGNETELRQCQLLDEWIQEDVECGCLLLTCQNEQGQAYKEGDVRLENSILQYYHDNEWAQICNKKITIQQGQKIAISICQQLGTFKGEQYFQNSGRSGPQMISLSALPILEDQIQQNILQINGQYDQDYVKYQCPQYQKYWISDFTCPTENETNINQCEFNSSFEDDHQCGPSDCLILFCDPYEDMAEYLQVKDGQLRQINGFVEIYYDSLWKPISDSGDEYHPELNQYGKGIDKASAHVICQNLDKATFLSIEKNIDCGSNFNGYWLGNIKCKGNEYDLSDCFSLPWGQTTVADGDSQKCVKIQCSDDVCVGQNKVQSSNYPYCQCEKGYYQDNYSADCLKCSIQCQDCIFSADNCLECSESNSSFGIINYDIWNYINEQTSNRRILQNCAVFGENCVSCDSQSCSQCTDNTYNLEENCGTKLVADNCSTNGCCVYSNNCIECSLIPDQYRCITCNPGYNIQTQCNEQFTWLQDPAQYCQPPCAECEFQNKLLTCIRCIDENMALETACELPITDNVCNYFSVNCIECELNFQVQNGAYCTKCTPNYDVNFQCINQLPDHSEDAKCVHISTNCIDCKGDFCYECLNDYLPDYNCQVQQKPECKNINEHCLRCNEAGDECLECEINYDLNNNCSTFLPLNSDQQNCLQFNENCIECSKNECTRCRGTWDLKYSCKIMVTVKQQCEFSQCDNCIGRFCLNEQYVGEQQEDYIEQELPTKILFSELSYEQILSISDINLNGQITYPTQQENSSWDIYTCTSHCAEGYFKNSNGICEVCNSRCKSCKTKNECIYCKYSDNEFVSPAPTCSCLKGSIIQDSGDCKKCDSGFYNFENEATQCKQCPQNVLCKGGVTMEVFEGFWRLHSESILIDECINKKDNCLGGTMPTDDQQCIKGHKGALCEACDLEGDVWGESYANSGEYECSPCSLVSDNTLKIIGLNIFQFITMFISVGGTINAIQQKIQFNSLKILFNTREPTPDQQGILMKILQNYFYIIGVIGTFNLTIPNSLKVMNSGVSNPTKQMAFSFDCFLNELQDGMPTVYFRVIWSLLISIFQVILVLGIFVILKLLKKTFISYRTFVFTTLIYQFIIIQPNIVAMMLETMACKEVGDKNYLLANPSKECTGTEYYTYSFSLILPLFLIIIIPIPFVLYYGIRKAANYEFNNQKTIFENKQSNKVMPSTRENLNGADNVESAIEVDNIQNENNQFISENQEETSNELYSFIDRNQELSKLKPKPSSLDSTSSLGTYGYLYLEYKNNVYAWEFVKIYQRILIATILAFYYQDVKVKGILVIMVVLLYILLSLHFSPYKLDSHNRIDIIAALTSVVSLILGIFIYQNDYDYWKVIAYLLLIFINVYFLVLIISQIGKSKIQILFQKHQQSQQQKQQTVIFNDKQKQFFELYELILQLQNSNNIDQLEIKNTIDGNLRQIKEIEAEIEKLENIPIKQLQQFKDKIEVYQKQVEKIEIKNISYNSLSSKKKENNDEILNTNQNGNQNQQLNQNQSMKSNSIQNENLFTQSQLLTDKKVIKEDQEPTSQKEQQTFQQKIDAIINIDLVSIQKQQKDDILQSNQKKIDCQEDNINNNDVYQDKYIMDKESYIEFSKKIEKEQKEKNEKLSKTKKQINQIVQKALFTIFGQPSILELQKAKYLVNMISQYSNNIVIEGFRLGLIQQFENQINQNNSQQQTMNNSQSVSSKQHVKKKFDLNEQSVCINFSQIISDIIKKRNLKIFQSIDIVKGSLKKAEIQQLQEQIKDLKNLENFINKVILKQVCYQYSERIKKLNYPTKYYELQYQDFEQQQQISYNFISLYINDLEKQGINSDNVITYIKNEVIQQAIRLTDKDIEEEYTAFKLFDQKEEGYITTEQVGSIMNQLGQSISLQELKKMVGQIDTNNNGKIEFCEFLSLMAYKKDKETPVSVLKDLFKYYVEDATGKMNYIDMDLLLQNIFNIQETKIVILQVIKDINQNNVNTLDFKRFQEIII